MVAVQYREAINLVKNKIAQIIADNLPQGEVQNSICVFTSNGAVKYIFNLCGYSVEVYYEFLDNFYKVRIENKRNNQSSNVAYITKSRQFHKALKKFLKENGLSRKCFENHLVALIKMLRLHLDCYGNLDYLQTEYVPDLKFDGFFL